MERCRSCRAEVIFVHSATSEATMILDAKPEKRIVLSARDDNPLLASVMKYDPARPHRLVARLVDVYTDHHVTCSSANEWRGRSRKNPPLSVVAEDPEPDGADPAMAEAGGLVVGLPMNEYVSAHCQVGNHGACLWIYGGRKCICECGHPLVPDAPKSPGVLA